MRHRDTVEEIGRLHVRNAAGDMIPLRALVADMETVLGPLAISRYNQVPTEAAVKAARLRFRAVGSVSVSLRRQVVGRDRA